MKTLRPLHGFAILLAGFFAAQVVAGALAGAGLAVAMFSGSVSAGDLASSEGVLRVFGHPLVLLPSAVGSSLALAAVAFGAALVLRLPARETLGIRRAPAAAWIAGATGALGCAVVADQSVFYFGRAFPSLTFGMLAAFHEAARGVGAAASVAVWIAMALFPGVCEELFFRGAFLSALRGGLRPATAVAVCAAVFGAFHVDPPQALGAAVLGGWLSWITVRTGSVGPAVLAHVLNNSLAFISARVSVMQFGYGTETPVPWGIVGAGTAVAAASALVIWLATRPGQDSSTIPG